MQTKYSSSCVSKTKGVSLAMLSLPQFYKIASIPKILPLRERERQVGDRERERESKNLVSNQGVSTLK